MPISTITALLAALLAGPRTLPTPAPALVPPPAPACASHSVPDERLDSASVLAVDQAWSRAYAAGDTAFMNCLFAPDFRDVNAKAEARDRYQVMRAALQHPPITDFHAPHTSELAVQLHGRVAVVSGYVLQSAKDGTRHRFWYSDTYVFDGHRWHAIYAQATVGPPVS